MIFFVFYNKFFHKNTLEESGTPSLLQKEKIGSAKSDVLKVLFPDIGKIFSTPKRTCYEAITNSYTICRIEHFCYSE